MQQLDREVSRHHALVVDANLTSRGVLTRALRDFGFASVKAVSRIVDARGQLEHRRFEVVICEDEFHQSTGSGQDLLEELRRERMLPYSTVFMMVTGQATYQKVAEAAEAALDSYLIKPYSGKSLFERLQEARRRKREFKDIFESIDANQYELAAQLCLNRFDQRQCYWLYAARIGTELLLDLKRHEEARRLLDAVIAAKSVPWARLGIARVQFAEGDVGHARRTLELLLGDEPQYADSYDVMGRVQMEQGHIAAAMETYRTAAMITPGCILRLQHCGTLAFYAGETATSADMLERTWHIGKRSKLFDPLSLLLLGYVRCDERDAKGMQFVLDAIERYGQMHGASPRLHRMARTAQALDHLLADRTAPAVEIARELAAESQRSDFGMEAATNLLSLWARMNHAGVDEAEYSQVVRSTALRFSVSRASTEILIAAARGNDAAVAAIRGAHGEVMQLAEAAMGQALRGNPRAAVQALLHHGGDTGNAKLIEMATLVAKRHAARIDDVDAMLETAAELAQRHCSPEAQLAHVRRSARSPGGMVLRR